MGILPLNSEEHDLQRALVASRRADPEKLATLVDMGFDERLASDALEACTNDVPRAVDYLTSQPPARDVSEEVETRSLPGTTSLPSTPTLLSPALETRSIPGSPPSPIERTRDASEPAPVQAERKDIGNCVVCLDAAAEYAVVPC